MSARYETHMSHCNQGELVGLCKYGPNDEDCPAIKANPPKPAAHNADAALREAVEALERAAFWVHHGHNGKWLGGATPPQIAPPHWRDCPSPPCVDVTTALSALRSPGTGETKSTPSTNP